MGNAAPGGFHVHYPAAANEPVLIHDYGNYISFLPGAGLTGHFKNIDSKFPDKTMECCYIRRNVEVFLFPEQAEQRHT